MHEWMYRLLFLVSTRKPLGILGVLNLRRNSTVLYRNPRANNAPKSIISDSSQGSKGYSSLLPPYFHDPVAPGYAIPLPYNIHIPACTHGTCPRDSHMAQTSGPCSGVCVSLERPHKASFLRYLVLGRQGCSLNMGVGQGASPSLLTCSCHLVL